MAKRLYCSQCDTEYWGPIQNAECSECEHKFLQSEIEEAIGDVNAEQE